ncbi:hypothetical protein C2W62_24440 [Candidatus Entotheonella serta]|nr:hypothetical protein C2W62_24440 [Candidatus Entotheonella serta]
MMREWRTSLGFALRYTWPMASFPAALLVALSLAGLLGLPSSHRSSLDPIRRGVGWLAAVELYILTSL